MRVSRSTRQLLTLGLGVVLAVVWWLTQHGGDTTDPGSHAASDGSTYSGRPESGGDRDPESGLPYVAEADLPREAGETLDLIDAGGPFRYDRDGVDVREPRADPARRAGAATTASTPCRRPARTIAAPDALSQGDEGQYYWTEDHYASFERIDR